MDKFEELVNKHLKEDKAIEEGILQRTKQRIKNIGRRASHPYQKAFGKGDKSVDAMVTTGKGYRKSRTAIDIFQNAINDLQKLKIVKKEVDASKVASELYSLIVQNDYYADPEEDLSKLGKQLYTSELESEE